MTDDVINQLKLHKSFIESGFKPLDKEVIFNPINHYTRLPIANKFHLNYHNPDTNHVKIILVGVLKGRVTVENEIKFEDVLNSKYGDTQKDQLEIVVKNLFPKLDRMEALRKLHMDSPPVTLNPFLMDKIQSQRGDTTEPKQNNITP